MALIAIGLTLKFSVLRIPDFAHGTLYAWGAFLAFDMVTVYRLNFVTSILLAAVLTGTLGVGLEKGVYKYLRQRSTEVLFVAALGILIIMERIAELVWGDLPKTLPAPYKDVTVVVGGIVIPGLSLIMSLFVVVIIVLLYIFLNKTKLGNAARAMAENRRGVQLIGINDEFVSSIIFFLGSALGAVAGVFVGSEFSLSFNMGTSAVLQAFVVIILGGMGSIAGAIIGGLVIGVAESFTATFFTTSYQDLVVFGTVILVLILKPTGLVGKGE